MKKENAIFILESIDNYLKRQNDYSERSHDAIMLAVEALKEERPHGEWIPCSERLPEKFGFYIVTNENGDVFELNYNDATMHGGTWRSYCERKIVAWMPLPEPFKEEGGEK